MKSAMAWLCHTNKAALIRSSFWAKSGMLPASVLSTKSLPSKATWTEMGCRVELSTEKSNIIRPAAGTLITEESERVWNQTEIAEDAKESAILQISTFKRKKPKVRKDRARTIRRKIKRKSQKKRDKYNL